MSEMTYAGTGVDYSAMDPFKRDCQKRAGRTNDNARRLGFRVIEETRGESVLVMYKHVRDNYRRHFAHLTEGLGTKNLVADAVRQLTGKTYYQGIAQDTVAMIVNDMATLGISPVALGMHLAVGNSRWFKDHQRATDLIEGWGDACDLARCVWDGGETPTLQGIIMPDAALLSGSTFGIAQHGILDPATMQDGDTIIFLESSGIHANGLTMARHLADMLPEGYATKLTDGRMYGEALLDPTHIYCGFIEDCLEAGVKIRYGMNITGHGWRKIMRAPQLFTYVIEWLPAQRPIFEFIQKFGRVSDEEAYGNLNMGAGFALIVPQDDERKLFEVHHGGDKRPPFEAFIAGYIRKSSEKKVVIEPKGLMFTAETLAVR